MIENSHGLTDALFWDLHWETAGNHKARHSNQLFIQASPRYKCIELLQYIILLLNLAYLRVMEVNQSKLLTLITSVSVIAHYYVNIETYVSFHKSWKLNLTWIQPFLALWEFVLRIFSSMRKIMCTCCLLI